MKEHPPDLARLISGELDPDSPEGSAMLAESGMTRADLEELRALAGELDEAAAFREGVERDAAELVDVPGLDAVRRVLDDQRRGSTPAPRARWVRWLPLAAALLLVPLLYELFFAGGRGGGREGEQLMGGDIDIAEPVGEVETFGEVRWKGVAGAEERYHLEVRDASEGARSELLLLLEDLREPRVTLPSEAEEWNRIKIWITQPARDGTEFVGWSVAWRRRQP